MKWPVKITGVILHIGFTPGLQVQANRREGEPLKYNLRDKVLLLLDQNRVSRMIQYDEIKEFVWFDPDKK